ncbi:hypothetical protein ZOSMA_69G00050 [Zostera marina]|uniref:Uncharacterized protein n=1 Tax=Zostera marina TaxID=29655 RepID=A0A0K9NRA1_ZOSMR|nr:hypothetical protein ZOSMA_69G00050 [Zostera marina]
MAYGSVYNRYFLLHSLVQCFIVGCLSFHHEAISGIKILNVGEELEMENLAWKSEGQLYHLRGLRDLVWYEIKISYPASIPAAFTIQLRKGSSGFSLGKDRKLLNTEKLIFKASFDESGPDSHEHYVLVTAKASGVVAKPGVKDREAVLFNIVCDELSFGIPYKAWWVVMAAVGCLALAFIIPKFIPLDLSTDQSWSADSSESKAS